jgi:hypothetical protein
MEEVTNVTEATQEQQQIGIISHNMKYLTNRLVNTEMALDVFIGMAFEKDNDLKTQFEELFKERMESIRQQYEAKEEELKAAQANEAKAAENVDVVVTPQA